jgi:magnesium-transporting ATPase (P-type)
VVSGTGTMLVINIGNNSAIGKIQEIVVTNNNELTPLQLKLELIA